ncbi:MAG: hypothetical protein CME71_12930 [Halobacteriovorax sp.]|nr:hypothetical protein [Halobacteriovorax sp.]
MRARLRHSFICLLAIFALTSVIFSGQAQAQVDTRVKALGTMAMYGTVGGALLGTASLAFGTSGRAPAVGASLGLYAGILFGTYVVASHYYKRNYRPSPQENYYPETTSPYEDNSSGVYRYADPSFGIESPNVKKPSPKARQDDTPIWYMNLLHFQF